MYGNLISDYQKALSEYNIDDIDSDEEIEKNYKLANTVLLAHVSRYKNYGVKLTYCFYDIDNNGIKELIIGADESAGAIYSYDLESKKPVKIYYQDTMERGTLSIYDNGIILSQGAGGAALHYFCFGKISDKGTSFDKIEDIAEEYIEGNESPIYTDVKTGKTLNYNSLDEIMDKYVSKSDIVSLNDYTVIE